MKKSTNNSVNKKIYVAYGSNLNISQMSYRCPDAEVVGVGTLENYQLSFKGWADHGVATVSKKEGFTVPVALWAISEADEKNLDVYEGWPHLYRKENIEVKLNNGEIVTGMVYIMNAVHRGTPMLPSRPTPIYYNTIAEGYRHFKFNQKILGEAYKPFLNFNYSTKKSY